MQLVATYDFRIGLRDQEEIIRRGETFTPRATISASADEAARHMIRQGSAVTPEAWAARKPKSDQMAAWAARQVENLNDKTARQVWFD